MRVSKEHKEKVRQEILEAAGKGFREQGYGGLGVDGLAKRAGLTSGAFYKHFPSKDDAFKAAVVKGLQDYAQAVQGFEADHGEAWTQAFINYYLGKSHVENLACSCAVPGLSAEVMRADKTTKKAYEDEINTVADNIASGLEGHTKEDAWALMALMAGAVMMARCVSNPKKSKEILSSAQRWAETMVDSA